MIHVGPNRRTYIKTGRWYENLGVHVQREEHTELDGWGIGAGDLYLRTYADNKSLHAPSTSTDQQVHAAYCISHGQSMGGDGYNSGLCHGLCYGTTQKQDFMEVG